MIWFRLQLPQITIEGGSEETGVTLLIGNFV